MYSNILLFIENKNYIITTCFLKEEDINNNIDTYSRIYSLEKGHFIKNIKGSNLNSTFSVLHWYNKNDNNDYIIECCIGKIFAYNLTKDEIYINYYDEFKEIYFFNGIIILKNNYDYLVVGGDNGMVYIWNLTTSLLFSLIDFNKNNNISFHIFHIENWNTKYFCVSDFSLNAI